MSQLGIAGIHEGPRKDLLHLVIVKLNVSARVLVVHMAHVGTLTLLVARLELVVDRRVLLQFIA